jgi:hypothetical protein
MRVNNSARRAHSKSPKLSIKSLAETPPALQLRAIGKRAHKEGGREKMLATFWRLKRRGISVGYAWDGIGGWYK